MIQNLSFPHLSIVLVSGKVLDLLVSSRLLPSELVAREGEDPQPGIFLRQLHQLAVVDVGLASPGGHVDDDQDLALVLGQADRLAINISYFKLMHGATHVDTTGCLELLACPAARTSLLICFDYITRGLTVRS